MNWKIWKKGNKPKVPEVRSYSYTELKQRYLRRSYEIESSMLGTRVDIVVPVYSTRSVLQKLLESIPKTNVNYRLILIDDAAIDEKTRLFLAEYAENHKNVELVRNAQSIGQVGCINRGLAIARNHVVLLSDDVELPQNWLERLIAPIVKDPTVASATPFTNSGGICSFPLIGKDNGMFNQLSVNKVDGFFRQIRSIYTDIPSGVGFCMAMNQNAIREVGLMDQKTFGKGYGEEIDWCRRAISKGFRNVMVENLYVYHNTGGSYIAEEKRRRIQMNREKLAIKQPDYAEAVRRYLEQDPVGAIRSYIFCRLTSVMNGRRYMIFHNEWAGSANVYIQRYAEKQRDEKAVTAIIRYQRHKQQYQIEYQWEKYRAIFEMPSLDEVLEFCSKMEMNQLIVNQLVTYPKLEEHLRRIREYAEEKGIRLMAMVHDYYLICPSVFLMNDHQRHCGIPAISECDRCIQNNANCLNREITSVREWRKIWRSFLLACQEVRVFSQDSARLVKKAYGGLDQIQVLPVQHTVLPKIRKDSKTTDTLNIGILGTLTNLKGAKLVQQMVQIAEERKLDVRFVLCGSSNEKIKGKYFKQTGTYKPEMLPKLIQQHDIDLFFIASICPETFSYTTQEAMEMGMPVACLPLGAPAERVVRYEKGKILSEPNAEHNLMELIAFGKTVIQRAYTKDKALVVVEEKTEAGRYRTQHLAEQLYGIGIASDCLEVKEIISTMIRKYKWVIFYRCSASKKVQNLITAANDGGASIWYSMDDYVFNYKAIQDLDLTKHPEYRELALSSDSIAQCMKLCDGILVPTEALKREVMLQFKGKPVVVQRSVASYEMQALSKRAITRKRNRFGSVILGYFSESNMYNADFAAIEPVLLEIMEEYPNVKLRLGGNLEVSKEMEMMGDRVKRWASKPWQEQPDLYAKIDIQLMPLLKTVYHNCKSETKWVEAALVKIPTVASYNQELAQVIENGTDGMLCRSKAEWKDALVRLIEDTELRKAIGEKANEKVLQMYTSTHLEEEVQQIFK